MTDLKSADVGRIAEAVRPVTEEEVAFFRENGWAKLPGLVNADLAEELLARVLAVSSAREGRISHNEVDSAYRTAEPNGLSGVNFRESDPFIGEFVTSRALGEASAELLGVRPLRLWSDSVFGKLGRGGDQHGTAWHQDFPSLPMDRAIGCQLWVALVEITPDMGPLQYLSGSHREPPLGRGSFTERGMVDVYPWLLDKYSVSPAHHLQPGDVMAHHSLTFHSAQPNRTDRDRVALASHRFDARALYTGLVNDRSDGRGLVVGQTFDHPFFPVVVD